VKQHLRFRGNTWTIIDEMNDCSDRMYQAERVVAQTFPVYESRYKTDAHTPFKLFDCLVPELRKHFRVPIAMLPKGYDTDIKM